MGLGEIILGEMGLGEMGQNQYAYAFSADTVDWAPSP